LDANSFIRLVDGREANIFQVYQQYYEISRTIESQMVIIKKQFSLNSVNNIVLSSYHQSDQVVYIVDFWSDQETFGITEEVFSSILPTLITSPAAVVGQDYTTLDDSLFYETDHFSFQVPVYWKLTRTSAESSVVDTFRSPDEMAIFQTIVYNDGRPISKSEAGSFVLVLLNNFYTNEITVTSDRITIDQQEELTWYSSLSNMQGITSFQVRDNTLIIFTILYKNDYESNYRPILEQILSTYQAIPATDNP
jgi:hypothetical protein